MTAEVSRIRALPPLDESHGARIRRLRLEALSVAVEHMAALHEALQLVGRLSAEVAEGGDAFPVGVRELSRRLTEDARKAALGLTAIQDRTR